MTTMNAKLALWHVILPNPQVHNSLLRLTCSLLLSKFEPRIVIFNYLFTKIDTRILRKGGGGGGGGGVQGGGGGGAGFERILEVECMAHLVTYLPFYPLYSYIIRICINAYKLFLYNRSFYINKK